MGSLTFGLVSLPRFTDGRRAAFFEVPFGKPRADHDVGIAETTRPAGVLEGSVSRTSHRQHFDRSPVITKEFRMHLEVNVLHHDYPSRVREIVEQKLEPLRKFYQRTVSMRAVLERQNEEHRVEIVANVGHGTVLVADAREDGFNAALDEAAERMGRLLRRYNEKRTHNRRRSTKV